MMNCKNRNMRPSKALLSVLSLLSVMAFGCANSTPTDPIVVSNQALGEEVATCESTSRDCILSAGSINGIEACRISFTTCLEEAAEQIVKTQETLQQCAEDANQCILYSEGPLELNDCRVQYNRCALQLDSGTDDPATTPDDGDASDTTDPESEDPTVPETGGFPNVGDLIPGFGTEDGLPTVPGLGDFPGVSCMEEMRECIWAGTDAFTCGDDARECLFSDGEEPEDPDVADEGTPDSEEEPTTPGADEGDTMSTDCRAGLRECLSAGKLPSVCAEEARACASDDEQPPIELP